MLERKRLPASSAATPKNPYGATSMTMGILNHSPIAVGVASQNENRCQELAALVTRHTDGKGNGFHQTGIDQLEFQRESAAPVCLHGVSTPIFAILLQGKKQALLGDETYSYSASQYLVVSVDLPISGFVVEATPDRPYLGFKLDLIKTDLNRSMRVEDLADRANMSASSFHHHFKTVTSMSPLQFQKQLRLLEARRLMLTENSDATNAAYRVGYESTSQFSREYSRMFGAPPIRDIERLRTD